MTPIGFLLPQLGRPSGGSLYNECVLQHWPGWAPAAVREDLQRPDETAAALLRHRISVCDGLWATRDPVAVERARAAGCDVVLLIHMPQPGPDGPAAAATTTRTNEARAVTAASVVVATSRHTAEILRQRCPGARIVVAVPGVAPAVISDLHEPPVLLSVGSLGPLKNQDSLIAAASRCAHLAFQVHLVGPTVSQEYETELRALAARWLPGRVTFSGALVGDAVDHAYRDADLLVSISHAEAYGMVVTEALAHGVPAVVGRGTGAVEALAAGGGCPGTHVRTTDVDELAEVLRTWLADPDLRLRWRRAALAARPHLPTWEETAQIIASACVSLSGA